MKKRKGLTLIEIILAMLILGMVTVVFLTIFNTGNRNIASSGDKTKILYDIQKQVDNRIKEVEDPEYAELEKETTKEIDGVTIITEDLEVEIKAHKIAGKLITGRKDGIEITTFVPD